MKSLRGYLLFAGLVMLVAAGLVYGPAMVERLAYAAAKGGNAAVRDELVQLSRRETLSKLFRAVSKAVRPAVVEVRSTRRISMGPMLSDPDDFFGLFGRNWPFPQRRRGAPQPEQRHFVQRALGSGVIVDASKGYVLTNHHVVAGAKEVKVILADGRELTTEWVRSDAKTDLAVVKIKADRLLAAPLGDSDRMEVGDWVLAVGAPEGLRQTVTAGIISAKGRTTGGHAYENFLQTDAAINHGNSGGPLVNMRGEVIGINSAIVSRSGMNAGIGLSIPSNMARKIMGQLVDTGKVVRGFLGVAIQDADEELAKTFGLPNGGGVLVTKVLKDSPAEKAGLKEEDFIVAINGEAVANVNALRNRVADLKPGTKAKFTVWRKGEKRDVPVEIAAQPMDMFAGAGAAPRRVRPDRYGVTVETLTADQAKRHGYAADATGVLVTKVQAGSDADDEGVAPGMVIDRVNGRAVASAEQFTKALDAAKGKKVRFRLMSPGGMRRYVVINAK